ncbi:VWA domain-containing protein [Pontibacter sp. G13]|uniref:VWA domain-containing protein n=1 Tax=Pontibacter sp. G13 TaxID=3074898 RepID=UPI00288BC082|nr:VWA domain-containing protein [Pontibacter sp. G13]WNJ21264.1 VWA domain-containing protein [Pontibacter sp. G13]
MNPSENIEQELASFIHLGGIMDESARREAAYWMMAQFQPGKSQPSTTWQRTYPQWNRLIQQVVSQKELGRLTKRNRQFALGITREILHWCSQTFRKYQHSGKLKQDWQEHENLSQTTTKRNRDQWIRLVERLASEYPLHHSSWNFYLDTLRSQQSLDTLDNRVLLDNILQDWQTFLQVQRQEAEGAFIDQAFDQYYSDLQSRVSLLGELQEHIGPIYNFLGQQWENTLGKWASIPWKELEAVAKSLEMDYQVRDLAFLLGKWRREEDLQEFEHWEKPIDGYAWKPNPLGQSEIVGIHQSDSLHDLLPAEIALLATPETELIFSKKYVEKKLLTFDHRSMDQDSDPRTEEEKVVKQASETPGPFVMLLDTSGSMFGEPERIAKAISLAVLRLAMQQKRKAWVLSFSTNFKAIEMNGLETDIQQMVAFLQMSFHGGTDLSPALRHTVELLGTPTYQRADVVILSDFMIPRLDPTVQEQLQVIRDEQETKFHSLIVGRNPDPSLAPLPIFDHHWVYDLNRPKLVYQTMAQVLTPAETAQ